MFDYGNFQYIYFFSCTRPLRRNDHRNMDSNGCVWKNSFTCNPNHYGDSSTTGHTAQRKRHGVYGHTTTTAR